MEQSISLKTAAQTMGCSTEQVRRMVSNGSLRGWRFRREIRVFVSSISDYQLNNQIIPKTTDEKKRDNRGAMSKFGALSRELSNAGLI